MPDEIDIALQKLAKNGLPVPKDTAAALRRSIENEYGSQVSQKVIDDAMAKLLAGVQSMAHPGEEARSQNEEGRTTEVGDTLATVRGDFAATLRQFSTAEEVADVISLDFKLGTALDVLRGAGRFIGAQTDVDEYPAWELSRFYDRTVPRGFARGPKGTLIEVPDDDWPSRFKDAINNCDDSDEDKQAMLDILESTGRMIALKDSGVWDELGSNRDDTLGNKWPPFAFNSGYDVDGVPRNECVELGLLDADEKAERSPIDWENLISIAE